MLRAVAQEAGHASRPAVCAGAAGDLGICPHAVLRPFVDQDWLGLSFLHWRYDPAEVQRLLPDGVCVDTFDGDAWIALVPFLLRVRLPGGPVLPWVGVFAEINVRTYVRGPDGQRGVWFFSLEAPRRLAIWAARLSYHLPYRVAAVEMHADGALRTYSSCRTRAPQRGATSRARIEVGQPIEAAAVSPLEHFLTARWRLYAPVRGGVGTALVEHRPWRLWSATADDVDTDLLLAAGLSRPAGPPLVHACGDVHASLTRLRRCVLA